MMAAVRNWLFSIALLRAASDGSMCDVGLYDSGMSYEG